jgi:hypothetical protein
MPFRYEGGSSIRMTTVETTSDHATDTHDANFEAVKREVKIELKNMFAKKGELVRKLGEAAEKVVSDKQFVCQKIKETLKEEIEQGAISVRLIQDSCLPEWKQRCRVEARKGKKRRIFEAVSASKSGASELGTIQPNSDGVDGDKNQHPKPEQPGSQQTEGPDPKPQEVDKSIPGSQGRQDSTPQQPQTGTDTGKVGFKVPKKRWADIVNSMRASENYCTFWFDKDGTFLDAEPDAIAEENESSKPTRDR